jgi:hypothetical protein
MFLRWRIESVIPFSESPATPYTRSTPAADNASTMTSATVFDKAFPFQDGAAQPLRNAESLRPEHANW